jgi:hypothetical protein
MMAAEPAPTQWSYADHLEFSLRHYETSDVPLNRGVVVGAGLVRADGVMFVEPVDQEQPNTAR